MADYRNTEYCEELGDIKEKKKGFKERMIADHPRMVNFYKYLHDKDGKYKLPYIEMYNSKCVYCGNSLKNISIDLFEIDHYINEASYSNEQKISAHQIENLVPACQTCNRGKMGITINKDYVDKLDPEGESIKQIFYRTSDYRIRIAEEYLTDTFIIGFYDALAFSLEQRRLDYLLLKMRGLYKKLNDYSQIKKDLLFLIDELQRKRNCLY